MRSRSGSPDLPGSWAWVFPLVHLKLRPSQVFLKKISALILFWTIFILRYASRHSRHTLSLLKVKRPRSNSFWVLLFARTRKLFNESQVSRSGILRFSNCQTHFLFSKDSESLGERVEVVLFNENKQSPKKILNFCYLDSSCNYLRTLCKKLYNISINQKTLRRFYNVNKSCLYI